LDIISAITAFENAIEKIIGTEKGTINIVNRDILKIFHKKIKT
jgi:hypothetical protein